MGEDASADSLHVVSDLPNDDTWLRELEEALLDDCDATAIRLISKGRKFPPNCRSQVWLHCLGVSHDNCLEDFDGIYDLAEQDILREDCQDLVEKLGNEEEDKVSVVSDIESIITHFCKSENKTYSKDNGWLDMIQRLIAIKLPKAEIYNCFTAMYNKFIPRSCTKNAEVYHVFRLLVLYHDPELCSILDTKKVLPDSYAQPWFQSLFASSSKIDTCYAIWDAYFQQEDPFFLFFLSLVVLATQKDRIISHQDDSKDVIINIISTTMYEVTADDIYDFFSLAHYYAERTPYSFKSQYLPIFSDNASGWYQCNARGALCMPLSVYDLMSNQVTGEVRFFLVDCRPAEQYNAGHLPTAFHLDANLMLQEPDSFATAVQALFAAQKQASDAQSSASGEHLCFIGSGRETEDQYVFMVIASFLQKHCQYVSFLQGGFQAIHDLFSDDLEAKLSDHDARHCIVCNPGHGDGTTGDSTGSFIKKSNSFLEKLSSAMKFKSVEVKEKIVEYITNPSPDVPQSTEKNQNERHVSRNDKVGKRYRGMASVFSIDDENDDDSLLEGRAENSEVLETVSIDTWLRKPEVVASYPCQLVRGKDNLYDSYLLVTDSHLFALKKNSGKKGTAQIVARRPLYSIVRITSRKNIPELITFKYGVQKPGSDDFTITEIDRFLIPRAADATKLVKQQITKLYEET